MKSVDFRSVVSDGLISDDNREPERNYSSSFQEFSVSLADTTNF